MNNKNSENLTACVLFHFTESCLNTQSMITYFKFTLQKEVLQQTNTHFIGADAQQMHTW